MKIISLIRLFWSKLGRPSSAAIQLGAGHERSSLSQFSSKIEFYLEKLVAHEHGRRRLGQIAVLHLAIHGRDVNRLERQVTLQQQKFELNLAPKLFFLKNLVHLSFKLQ